MLKHVLTLAILIIALCAVADEPAKAPSAAAERTPSELAWDDLRWLMTALEAYASDNEWLYAAADGRREGALSELEQLLEWYYANTYPRKDAAPKLDPWERPYRFVVSDTRKQYAIYSGGPDGKLGDAEEAFLKSVKEGRLSEGDLKQPRVSHNFIVASGVLVCPPEVLGLLKPHD